jgi:uncharacterized membrane protein
MKRWLIAASILVSLVIPVKAHAAEQISNFDSTVTVQKNGRVDVTETISYDFGYASRHGIYRYIPVVYIDDQGVTYKPGFKFDSVAIDGQPTKFSTSREGDNEVVKIGEASKTITGPHVYTINYHFDALLIDKDGDLLRYNVTGNGWKVPIAVASVKVVGPTSSKLACYTGAVGSAEKECKIDTTTSTVTTTNIIPGNDFTVEALWPSGTVSGLLLPYKTPLWQNILIWAAIIYVLVGIGLLIAALIRWLGIRSAEKRAQRDQTVVAQYEAPKNLTPGEIGFITDNKTNMIEITATLIHAAVLGFIKIEQVAEKSLLKKAEYKLTRLKAFAGLEDNEEALLVAIFDSKNEINLKDIDKTAVPNAIKNYQDDLRSNLRAKGMYTDKSKFTSAAVAGSLFVLLFLSFTPFIFISIAFILPIALYLYKRAGQTPRRTPEGLQTWAYAEGFKLFLSVTEKDRLAFTDAPARTPKQFSTFLPYAIALGVEKEWAKQFEGIDISKSMGWYGGNTQAFTAGYLVGNLSDSFASTVATSTAPQTSSSGFGGGSSGGGFSGGGGGSW